MQAGPLVGASGRAEGLVELEADESDLFAWRVKLSMPERTELHRQLCAHARERGSAAMSSSRFQPEGEGGRAPSLGQHGRHSYGRRFGRRILPPPSAPPPLSAPHRRRLPSKTLRKTLRSYDAVVTLELAMPPDFPSAPPFVRVISSRFAFPPAT